jgi:hypothetical protein
MSDNTNGQLTLDDPDSTAPHSPEADAIIAAKDGLSQDELVGDCPRNARRLYDECRDRGITAEIVCGGVLQADDADPPETMDEAIDREDVVVHWWVQMYLDSVKSAPCVADLATELSSIRGQTIFRTLPPEEYVAIDIDPPDTEMFSAKR